MRPSDTGQHAALAVQRRFLPKPAANHSQNWCCPRSQRRRNRHVPAGGSQPSGGCPMRGQPHVLVSHDRADRSTTSHPARHVALVTEDLRVGHRYGGDRRKACDPVGVAFLDGVPCAKEAISTAFSQPERTSPPLPRVGRHQARVPRAEGNRVEVRHGPFHPRLARLQFEQHASHVARGRPRG